MIRMKTMILMFPVITIMVVMMSSYVGKCRLGLSRVGFGDR